MFQTLTIYKNKEVSLEDIIVNLEQLGYHRQEMVSSEGDFSLRGDTLEVYPVNFEYPLRIEWEFDIIKKIYTYDKLIHKKIIDYEFCIIIPYFKKKRPYLSEELPLETTLRIKDGDYVVHNKYGIGIFKGVKKIKDKNHKETPHFVIEYRNNDRLYVPFQEGYLIQKYTSFSSKAPTLNILGSREWQRTKERVEKGIKEFALKLLRLEAQRKITEGFPFSLNQEWQKLFEDKFPYDETPDQKKAWEDVKKDMTSTKCMDRIICGDVGYGKTEVAMRAAFCAITSFKQVAFLVPTTILAYQHYENLKSRLRPFPFRVEMLSRFRSPAEQKSIVKELREGKIDLVVGTHRLLSDDISFSSLGLLIIDEEHKFGVRHKEKIKELKVGVDVLTLTATPIPRTLYMSLVGIKDISVIKTPPKQRCAIKTKIVNFSHSLICDIITKEVKRGGQVFFINNRIETLPQIERFLHNYLPSEIKFSVIHGRLSPSYIEKVMLLFIKGEIDCLVSTAIVESGIDIPAANTIIINNAHHFGLADLHQLRGRVGRFNRQAYAYLVIPNKEKVSSEALERLKMIEEFSHLGAGFDIAMKDLELRGAGNILGKQQHGFVWMVGFDLYCRLLKKEIEYLKSLSHYKDIEKKEVKRQKAKITI